MPESKRTVPNFVGWFAVLCAFSVAIFWGARRVRHAQAYLGAGVVAGLAFAGALVASPLAFKQAAQHGYSVAAELVLAASIVFVGAWAAAVLVLLVLAKGEGQGEEADKREERDSHK